VAGYVQLLHSVLYIRNEHLAGRFGFLLTVRTPGQTDNFCNSTVISAVYVDLPDSRAMAIVP
jgi:hypothetical protein